MAETKTAIIKPSAIDSNLYVKVKAAKTATLAGNGDWIKVTIPESGDIAIDFYGTEAAAEKGATADATHRATVDGSAVASVVA